MLRPSASYSARWPTRCPGFGALITADGLHPSIAANLNGDVFVSDLATQFADDDRLSSSRQTLGVILNSKCRMQNAELPAFACICILNFAF